MELGRRQFVELSVVFGVSSVIAACSSVDETKTPTTGGTDGGSDSGTKTDAGADSGADAGGDGGSSFACRSSITENHAHTIVVPVADLTSTSTKSYSIMGGSPHNHEISLEAQDFADLKAGLSVKKSSTFFDTHNHDVTILCASL